MSTDWIEKINELLDALGLYPDVEAEAVQGNPGVVVLEDTQATPVYQSPEGVYRVLTTVHPPPDADQREVFELVGQALQANLLEDEDAERVQWNSHDGYHWI